jgi:predicted RNA-binding protein associated with RNAse of E/G family
VFWTGPERRFQEWYVNLQEPIERRDGALVTFDHELDLRIAPDGSWALKDDELLTERVRQGRFSDAEAAAIRARAQAVIADHERGARWWDDAWSRWTPPPGWDLETP